MTRLAPFPHRTLLLVAALLVTTTPPHAQQRWLQRTPTTNPPAFGPSQAMTYDAIRKKTVLLGNGPQGVRTWEWDGDAWTQVAPGTNPPATLEYTLGHDPVRRRLVCGCAQQTWEWDPLQLGWIKSAQSSSRGSRLPFPYVPARGKLLAVWAGGSLVGETWDGAQWGSITAPTLLSPGRNYSWAAYDSDRQRIVAFGGINGVFVFSDTWEWDGTDWKALYPAHVPPGRYGHSMVYDPDRQRIVMFGGFNSNALDDLWEWDGSDWQQVTLSPRPAPRYMHCAVYDTARHRMVVFGGTSGFVPVADTWEYFLQAPSFYQPFGQGCAGSAGVPSLAAAPGSQPRIGATFSVDCSSLRPGMVTLMTLGASKFLLGSYPLPLDLTVIGMSGCWAYTSMDATFGLSNTVGTARWSAAIPSDLSLLGARFYNQAFVADPGINILGVVATNAAEGWIGSY